MITVVGTLFILLLITISMAVERGGYMHIMLDPKAIMPKRAHFLDAGLDLLTPEYVTILPGKMRQIDTGVHIELPPRTVGIVQSKSGLAAKGIVAIAGVIDEGYTGSIAVMLENHSPAAQEFKRGDKIAQLIIMPILAPSLTLVDELSSTARGNCGFGSTGR